MTEDSRPIVVLVVGGFVGTIGEMTGGGQSGTNDRRNFRVLCPVAF